MLSESWGIVRAVPGRGEVGFGGGAVFVGVALGCDGESGVGEDFRWLKIPPMVEPMMIRITPMMMRASQTRRRRGGGGGAVAVS